ncbi:MAG: sulfite exporter TauE/SafE family protein [Bacteroidota bacterium]
MDAFFPDLTGLQWLLFIGAGIFTGVINTLAGSGSLITLPIFIFICGLPADVANGTNRIGVFMQSLIGIRGFQKQGQLPTAGLGWLLGPMILGAIIGAQLATQLDKTTMNYVIGGLMVFMLLVLLVNPKRWIRESAFDPTQLKKPLTLGIFFLVGLYGGFIQAGVGLFLLAGLVLLAKYDLKQANAIKLLAVAVFSIPAIIIFWQNKQIVWGFGIMMGIYQSIGAYLGVKIVSRVPNTSAWIHKLLILIVIVSASKFLGLWDLLAAFL